MSHVHSSGPDPGSERLTPEEARRLLDLHRRFESEAQGHVTVQDMSETLGLPPFQVKAMVDDLRSKPRPANEPMSNATWIKTRLWIWALIAGLVVAMTGSGVVGEITDEISNARSRGPGNSAPNRVAGDGIYDHGLVVTGRQLLLKAPPGFSFEMKVGTTHAAVNGDSRTYPDVDELAPQNREIVQKQLASAVVDGLDKMVKQGTVEWVDGAAVSEVLLNYYPGGDPVAVDLTLNEAAFPFDPASEAGKALTEQVRKAVAENWDEVID